MGFPAAGYFFRKLFIREVFQILWNRFMALEGDIACNFWYVYMSSDYSFL